MELKVSHPVTRYNVTHEFEGIGAIKALVDIVEYGDPETGLFLGKGGLFVERREIDYSVIPGSEKFEGRLVASVSCSSDSLQHAPVLRDKFVDNETLDLFLESAYEILRAVVNSENQN